MNELFQNSIKRTPQKTPPIWFMRQAGRYHKHYQKIREKHSFMDMCKNPELAAEVTMGPIQDFDFDVAILFSDLLFPLEALGMGLEYLTTGPKLGFALTPETIGRLVSVEEALPQLEFQRTAMKATRERLPKNKSLIGFVGGPWTLFGYAAEGEHSGGLLHAKKNHGLMKEFFEKLLPLLKSNIQLQLDGGAEIVMIFDTAAGELSAAHFKTWTAAALIDLAKTFPNRLGYYSKGTMQDYFSSEFLQAPWAGMGFDHRWTLSQTFSIRKTGFVQGNFDQSLLFLEPNDFKRELQKYLEVFMAMDPQSRAGWVSGLGHGVLPKTPEENVRTLITTVRKVFS